MVVRIVLAPQPGKADRLDDVDLGFLPNALMTQCRRLIENYHELQGFSCLPDILWKSRLGPFIERHGELRRFLKEASRTRSAKKSRDGFVRIATSIFAMEILASGFAGWAAIYPEAAALAQRALTHIGYGSRMPLLELYLYPPKYINATALATLAPPAECEPWQAGRSSSLEPIGDKQGLGHAAAVPETADDKLAPAASG